MHTCLDAFGDQKGNRIPWGLNYKQWQAADPRLWGSSLCPLEEQFLTAEPFLQSQHSHILGQLRYSFTKLPQKFVSLGKYDG